MAGISFGDTVLMMAPRRTMYSYRIRPENLDAVPVLLFKSPIGIDKGKLTKYFAENCDNPYALFFVLSRLLTGQPIEGLTQFPPLSYPKFESGIHHLRDIADVGDSVFCFDRESFLSRIIRSVDYSPWSHVGTVIGPNRIVDVTLSGLRQTDFLAFESPSLDVALYRPKQDPTPEQKAKIVDFAERSLLARHIRYSWRKAFLIYLRKRWKLPVTKILSPGDLIYSNAFRLIGYA